MGIDVFDDHGAAGLNEVEQAGDGVKIGLRSVEPVVDNEVETRGGKISRKGHNRFRCGLVNEMGRDPVYREQHTAIDIRTNDGRVGRPVTERSQGRARSSGGTHVGRRVDVVRTEADLEYPQGFVSPAMQDGTVNQVIVVRRRFIRAMRPEKAREFEAIGIVRAIRDRLADLLYLEGMAPLARQPRQCVDGPAHAGELDVERHWPKSHVQEKLAEPIYHDLRPGEYCPEAVQGEKTLGT